MVKRDGLVSSSLSRLIHHPLRRLHVATLDGCEVVGVLLRRNNSFSRRKHAAPIGRLDPVAQRDVLLQQTNALFESFDTDRQRLVSGLAQHHAGAELI